MEDYRGRIGKTISDLEDLSVILGRVNEKLTEVEVNREWDRVNFSLNEKLKQFEAERQNLRKVLQTKEKREQDLCRELNDVRASLAREERLRKEEREFSLAEQQRLAEENDKLRAAYLPTAIEVAYRAWLQKILAADTDCQTEGMHYSGAVQIFIERYKKLREFAQWAKSMLTKAQREGITNLEVGLQKLEGFNFDKK